MPLATSVKHLLEKQQVAYALVDEIIDLHVTEVPLREQRLRHQGAAKSLLMSDDQGVLQVLFPADCLLDPKQLQQSLNRHDLRPMRNGELQSFFRKHNVTAVPALPLQSEVVTVVDKHLLEREQVLLDSGTESILRLSGQAFEALMKDAQVVQVCKRLDELERKLEACTHDEDSIFLAVKSFTGKRIRQRLEDTLELPPLPDTAQKIIKLRVDTNADVSDLANVVEVDPSLAAQVVSWSSSPYYSAPGKIKSIHDAIVRVLGFDMVLNLALGLALGKTLSLPKDGPVGETPYWTQSVYTAALVEGLVTAISREQRPGFGMAYLSGLLHNFGWLILAEVFPPYFSTISRAIEANQHAPPHLVDFYYLGVTRDQLAAWLMELWHMPDEVVVALRRQNCQKADMEHGEYAKLLLVAQRLLQQHGIGQGPVVPIPDEIYADLHLDKEKAEQTVATILEASGDLNSIIQQISA